VAYAHTCHPLYAFTVTNGVRLGLKEGVFDAVIVVGVLHHLEDSSALAALYEIRRVLKPGGQVLVIEPIPVVSSWNIMGRLIKSLDLGHFIRKYKVWNNMLSEVFTLKKAYQHRIGFNDLAVLLGSC
jgi:ubiquinone/menaquinone biosynthesis C-methylase UbiE